MSGYAVIETGGKQYRVTEGSLLDVERLDTEVGKTIDLDQVLALSTGDNLTIGTPLVEGATVAAEVLEHRLGDKIIVFKKKRRKGYKRKQGHRQGLTRIRVASLGGTPKKRKAPAKAAAPKTEETTEE